MRTLARHSIKLLTLGLVTGTVFVLLIWSTWDRVVTVVDKGSDRAIRYLDHVKTRPISEPVKIAKDAWSDLKVLLAG